MDATSQAAVLVMRLGAVGLGIGIGLIGGLAASVIGRNLEAAPTARNIMIIAIIFAESMAIYALVVAMIILFVPHR